MTLAEKKQKQQLPAKAGDAIDTQRLIPGSGRSPGGRNVSPLQYCYLAGYSPRGCKQSDMTERLNTHTHEGDPTLEQEG